MTRGLSCRQVYTTGRHALATRPTLHHTSGREFFRSSGPFNFDQPGVEPSEPVIANRGARHDGGAAHWDCVSEFIHQDWSEDLKKISVPVLAMNGDADQVVPHDTSGPRAVKLVKNGTLKTYPGYPHGMLTTHADVLNPDLLAFIQS
jgi:non-heme chloroperoxidase